MGLKEKALALISSKLEEFKVKEIAELLDRQEYLKEEIKMIDKSIESVTNMRRLPDSRLEGSNRYSL